MSLAVVFECGHVARVFVMFDNNSHGEGRTADVSALFARMLLANEVAYLVAVDDVLGFLEASARPVPAGRVVLNPATVGGACDACEGVVNGEHCGWPFLRGRTYLHLAGCIVSRVGVWRAKNPRTSCVSGPGVFCLFACACVRFRAVVVRR